ncbi:hypothetical protein DS834_06705 [Lactobacillus bombicola]|uniref:Uncharacterized protein n=1 Tax=Lactobacillus bombicola TaxID=1505723 RepID=A0ABX9LTF1_9LACO|nr:hypothetical protein [Lactobacillus bombicola]RHW50334.1 hypothetical protein DS834_06705 [Lactobacillus bombicola]
MQKQATNRNLAEELSVGKKVLNQGKINVGSTYAEVHVNKSSLIQSYMNKHLKDIIGDFFALDNQERQEKPDFTDKNKINKSTIYYVKIISKKAEMPFGSTIEVKVKDTEPLFTKQEIESITLGLRKPIVLTFDNLAYYHFSSGETIIAGGVHEVKIGVKEASEQ